MTAEVGYGPLTRIDGPPPIPPERGLLRTAEAPAAGVRIVPDADSGGIDRWINGVEVFPFPPDPGDLWDPACPPGTTQTVKSFGDVIETPQFGAFVVYVAETCTSYRVWNQDAFKARAVAALTAVESALVAKQLMYGAAILANPHLADGNGTFPNNNTVTSPLNGLALLEGEIAKSHRQGIVHCSPMAATTLMGAGMALADKTGAIRTINGVVVVPDFGYVDPASPPSHPAAAGSQEWMFATGPIDIRRSEIFVNPDTVAEALDRGTGATNSRPNSITYRAERYYLVDWDCAVQAAVLVDRCKTTC